MKIQILNDISDCVDGYNPVMIENGMINLDVPDNSVSSIVMINTIEQVPHNNINNFLGKIRQLLRMNGNLLITGVDANCLCMDMINKVLDCDVFNEVVYNRKAIYDCKNLSDRLDALGIKTEKMFLKGSTYELHAVRHN